MVHVPQFIAYTNFPLGFTSEQVVDAQHSFYDALYNRNRTRSVTFYTYPQHLYNRLGMIMQRMYNNL